MSQTYLNHFCNCTTVNTTFFTTISLSMFRVSILPIVLVILWQGFVKSDPSKIDSEVTDSLKKGPVNVVVSFVQGVKPALDLTTKIRSSGGPWEVRNQAVVDALRLNADNSQKGVLAMLSTKTKSAETFKSYKKYWSCNVMYVEKASAALIQAIATDPDVKQIRMESNGIIPGSNSKSNDDSSFDEKSAPPKTEEGVKNWGLTHIEVLKAWEELGGKKGEGVVVGTIGSGVRHTHEALKDNFVGTWYGWFDALDLSPEPVSKAAHGTHNLGVIAGSHGVGVAPGVKWMTCAACTEFSCQTHAILDCMEFISCPTLPDASNPDCSKAPRVIYSVWINDHGDTYYNDQILAWRGQGIIPVFSIGDSGIRCRSTMAPGELPWVFGVGSCTSEDRHYYKSSVGPAADGGIKPDIIAPGVNILSASDDSDNSYTTITGTYVAAPHVAGVIALLLGRDPDMEYSEVFDIIASTAEKNIDLNARGQQHYCKEGSKDMIPNIFFGHGRLHALRAVQEQTKRLTAKGRMI